MQSTGHTSTQLASLVLMQGSVMMYATKGLRYVGFWCAPHGANRWFFSANHDRTLVDPQEPETCPLRALSSKAQPGFWTSIDRTSARATRRYLRAFSIQSSQALASRPPSRRASGNSRSCATASASEVRASPAQRWRCRR